MAHKWIDLHGLALPLLALTLLAFAGCWNQRAPGVPDAGESGSDFQGTDAESGESETALPTRDLRMIVVDDATFGKAAQIEWQALSDANLAVTELPEADFLKQVHDGSIVADIVVYPSYLLGELAERKMVVRMPRRHLEGEPFAASDILPVIRRESIAWGGETYAVPFGSSCIVLAYRRDLIPEGSESAPPATWSQFPKWLEQFAQEKPLALALDGMQAADLFLACAAPYVRRAGQVSTVFDYRTTEPLIAQPPYVRALDNLAQLASSARLVDISEARRMLGNGEVAVAILPWNPMPDATSADSDPAVPIRFAGLPGTAQSFSFSSHSWQDQGPQGVGTVPHIGFRGRIGSVLRRSRRQRAAWSCLLQLTSRDHGTRLSISSQYTGPYRASQLDSIAAWSGPGIDAAANRSLSDVFKTSFANHLFLGTIRLPGRTRYMTVLSDAVRQVVRGELESDEALQQVDVQWRSITAESDPAAQTAAFSRSLGIDP